MYSRRLVASGTHLLASAAIATVTGAVVFLVWFKPPFAALAGGWVLFGILVGADVVLGPALTALVSSPGKARNEWRRDLTMIVAIQICAFLYGIYSIASARPVVLAFEIDRFRVVTAAEIEAASLTDAPPDMRSLSWTGPRLIAAVKPTNPTEQLRSIDLGLAGIDLSMDPRNWRPFDLQEQTAWKAARPIASLLSKYPEMESRAKSMASAESGNSLRELRFLPVMSRQKSWSAVVAGPNARIIGYLPVDGFL